MGYLGIKPEDVGAFMHGYVGELIRMTKLDLWDSFDDMEIAKNLARLEAYNKVYEEIEKLIGRGV